MNLPFNLEWIWWIAQIVIDVILLAAIFIMVGRQKKQKGLGQAPLAAEDFVEQAGQLAREFDRLLGEKRELVGTTLATLDARIDELRAMLEQASALQEKMRAKVSPRHSSGPAFSSGPAPIKNTIKEDPFSQAPDLASDDDPFELPPGHPLKQFKEAPEEVPQINEERDFRSQVLKMLGQGHSSQEIASITGRPRAEVELLIALIK